MRKAETGCGGVVYRGTDPVLAVVLVQSARASLYYDTYHKLSDRLTDLLVCTAAPQLSLLGLGMAELGLV